MVTGKHDTKEEVQNHGQAELTDDDVEAAVEIADEEALETDAGADDVEYEPGRKEPLDHGVKVRSKVKFGDGTYEHGELTLEGRGEDAEEAADDFEAALAKAEENGWTERLGALQPDPADDGGEDDA